MTQIRENDLQDFGIVGLESPASIPSIFHQDLAYFWALSANPTPEEWSLRVACWKKLLCWWLIGEVKESRPEEIVDSLAQLVPTDRNGDPCLNAVTWLRRSVGEAEVALGVLSPIVLVRPLPGSEIESFKWKLVDGMPIPWEDAICIELLCDLRDILTRTAGQQHGTPIGQYLETLGQILLQHFGSLDRPRHTRGLGRQTRPCGLLQPSNLEALRLQVNIRSARPDDKISPPPICDHCRDLLLPISGNLQKHGEQISLRCHSCDGDCVLDLESLCCFWFRESERLGVWTERRWFLEDGEKDLPPIPAIEPGRLQFVYPDTFLALAGKTEAERTLELRVPRGTKFVPLDWRDLIHEPFLWPGEGESGVTVLPIRPEYLDVLQGTEFTCRPENDGLPELRCKLRGLRWRVRQPLPCLQQLSLGLAVLPDPAKMPPECRWFRIFANENVSIGAISGTSGKAFHPSIFHTDDGLPRWLLLTARAEEDKEGLSQDASCMVHIDRNAMRPVRTGPTLEIRAGIDFGTVNSAVFLPFDQHVGEPFEPHRLRTDATRWLLRPDSDATADRIVDGVLPREREGAEGVIPSEMLAREDHLWIDWAEKPRIAARTARRYLFKNDPASDYITEAYLKELLAHAVIGYLCTLPDPPEEFVFDPVFTYPLTWHNLRRRRFKKIANKVCQSLAVLGASEGRREPRLLDESYAGVLSVGHPAADKLLLIVDLGGGSLDLSLGFGLQEKREFIGSLDAGGSYFTLGLSRGENEQQRREDGHQLERWIRARHANAGTRLRDQGVPHQLNRYYRCLATYLERLLLAYLEQCKHAGDFEPAETDKAETDKGELPEGKEDGEPGKGLFVELFLLGNGWRFVELQAREGQDPKDLFQQVFQGLCQDIQETLREVGGFKFVELTHKSPPSPKFAVAAGAFKVAEGARWREGESLLPCGITLWSTRGRHRLRWYETFAGKATEWIGGTVKFDFEELEGHLKASRAFGPADLPNDYAPEDDQLRAALIGTENVMEAAGTKSVLRGPLQLLLERIWIGKKIAGWSGPKQ